MTKLELQEKVLNLRNELATTIANGEQEKRELNETETSRLAEIRSEIEQCNQEIASIEEEERKLANNNQNSKNNKMDKKEVRLIDLVKAVTNGNVTDEQRQYIEGNKITLRTINVSNATEGQENVPEEKKALDVAIRNASVLDKMGCTWFSNAVGDISIPKYAGSTVGWKGENVAADNGEGAFSEVTLTPKRLTAYIDISKTFLAQDSNDAESILISDLADAIAEKLDKTVFGIGTGDANTPAGIMQGAHMVTSTDTLDTMTYNDVLAYESAVEEHNGTDFIFVANPKVKYQLKGTQMASGLNMVWNSNEIDGYKAVVSNSVEDKGVLCICPKDLVVATWSNVDITVDTLTRAINNEVRVVVNYLVDAKLRGDRLSGQVWA